MNIEPWIFWLGIEIIIALLAVIIVLMIAWLRSSKRHRRDVQQLLEKIHHLDALAAAKSAPDGHVKALEGEIESLKKQLEHERNNPFLQEKIDALMTENEDLQEQIDNLK
jgi:predicted nuclease with TOPRIM domain